MPTADYRLKSGKRVSGVTTIISGNLAWNSRALMHWAWEQGREGLDYRKTAEDAASAGTIAHAMIEADIKGIKYEPKGSPEIISLAETSFLAYLEWKDMVGLKALHTELALVSEEYGYGGTIDVAAIKKVPSIVDLKTSSGVYPDHRIQVSAYGRLWNEHFHDQKIGAYYILQLGKTDGSFHYHYWPELSDEWDAFKHLLALHELKKKIGR